MGGRDIGVVSMVFLTSSRSSSGLLFSAVVFASRVPLCLHVRGFDAFGFLWEREQVCDNVKRCKGG